MILGLESIAFQNHNYIFFVVLIPIPEKNQIVTPKRGVTVPGLELIPESDFHHGYDSNSRKNGIITPLD